MPEPNGRVSRRRSAFQVAAAAIGTVNRPPLAWETEVMKRGIVLVTVVWLFAVRSRPMRSLQKGMGDQTGVAQQAGQARSRDFHWGNTEGEDGAL